MITVTAPNLIEYNDIYGLDVNGYPSKLIDRDWYYNMLTNDNYLPSGRESYYIFEGGNLIIITPEKAREVRVTLYYGSDMHTLWQGAADGDTININPSLIWKAIPKAADKLKIQVGLAM